MAEDPEQPKGSAAPGGEKKEEEEAKDSAGYSREGPPAAKLTWDSDKGLQAPEPKAERKVTIYQHTWVDKSGYLAKAKGKKEGKYGSVEGEIGVGYGSVSASSGANYDLNEKEASLNLINAKVQISVVHAKVKGKFKLGAWISSFWKDPEPEPETPAAAGVPGMGMLMAARVGDLTTHGSPLAPGIGSTNVFIGNMPAWRTNMDFHACPIVKGVVPDVGGMVLVGAPTVFINFMNACRIMDIVVEVPGGPNPIAMGCPTVFIGPAGGGGGAASSVATKEPVKEKEKESEGVAVDGSGEGDLLTAGAEANVGAVFNKEAIKAGGKLNAMAAVAKGKIEGGLTIPLPWGHSVRLGAGLGGSVLSAGVDIHGEAGWTKEEGAHASWGMGAALGLGGSLDFSLGFK